ncbi:PTS-dependent dihydroxyacetone kinase, dihydroxyacetone-binding subunit DhaK [[Clostridium] hylemonae DSM 15053]|nr:PTS-dependent dihydroxyacetone kinase, dihydroxyacetone-binding subunit DhaK [[Clostridium] hylemonae DSM 15053]
MMCLSKTVRHLQAGAGSQVQYWSIRWQAAAAAGHSLEEVRRLAQKAADNVRTMGMAMSSCTIPAIGRPGFELADDEVELGMGIHGEPGVKRVKLMSAKETARVLLSRILNDLKETGSEFALMVNGSAEPL